MKVAGIPETTRKPTSCRQSTDCANRDAASHAILVVFGWAASHAYPEPSRQLSVVSVVNVVTVAQLGVHTRPGAVAFIPTNEHSALPIAN